MTDSRTRPHPANAPEHVWTVLCGRLLVDARTGTRTLLDVIDSITLPAQETGELVTQWRNPPGNGKARWTVRLLAVSPSGAEHEVGEAPIESVDERVAYSVVSVSASAFTEPGVFRLRVLLGREGGSTWREVGSLPIEVVGDGDETSPTPAEGSSDPTHEWDPNARYVVFTDGAARGNPGPAGIGVVFLTEDGEEVLTTSEAIGEATNNVAEYRALITALETARDLGLRRLDIRSDSELMVKQLNGLYRVSSPTLAPLHARASALLASFEEATIRHVPRSENAVADRLASDAASL